MENYRIDHAQREDSEEILNLYHSMHGGEMCNWSEVYPDQESIDFDLSRESLFVMKNENGEIIGTIAIDEDEELEALTCWSEELLPAGELARLAVRKTDQNQGIARILMQFGMDELKRRGFHAVHFLVYEKNQKALRSYAHFNFRQVGECDMFGYHFVCLERKLE